MPLKIYTSNRMERLVDDLERVVRAPRPAPFTPFSKEIIVVQSKGMQRWLSMELARRIGVWANCDFVIPSEIVHSLFTAVLPDAPEEVPLFRPEVMTWKLMGCLKGAVGRPGFEEITGYLLDDHDGLKTMQLAQRVADAFDRYTVYRPEMVLAWEKGEDDSWQAQLWRSLTGAPDALPQHRARLLAQFRQQVDNADLASQPRISVVGIPTLPPFHLEVLSAAARHIEVNLFLLNPCRQYWSKIVSERALAKLERRGLGPDEWYEIGNPLLASWGKLGKEFFEAVMNICGEPETAETFEERPDDSLLHVVQTDILDLRGSVEAPRELPQDDLSIQVHACHSPMREVEVLYDTLLDLFGKHPELSPRDVLVMTPEIETYAPYISAVFDTPHDGGQKIRYSIADRNLKSEGEAARALLAILRLCGSRFGVSTVLDVLETAPVARRFGMSGEHLETVRDWLRAVNIRWGIDARQRAEEGLPAFNENSWEAGLDRLLLGYALDGEGHEFFNDILPFDDVEGSSALVLGRFVSFCRTLFATCRGLTRPLGTADWSVAIRATLEQFVLADQDGEREYLALLELCAKLADCGAQGEFEGYVGIEVVRYWFEEQLGRSERGFGFLTGGVTFCAMLPMRSIPFPVVALIGMNDGAFPRRDRAHAFDLMAKPPRHPGDKSKREEDRYLFLETLLSARTKMHVSYVGQSIKDNSEIPPSVLVSELLEYLDKNFRYPDGTSCGKVLRHPLQPFSRAYFSGADPRLFSYSRQNYGGALATLGPKPVPAPFLSAPLEPWEEDGVVTLKALIDFLCNPAREFLKRRLGIRLEQGVEPLEECEPFALPALVKYRIEQEIVEALLQGEDACVPFEVARGRGDLPPGESGAALFDKLSEPAAGFAARVAEASAGEKLPPLDVDLRLPSGRIVGRIESLRSDRLLLHRYTKLKAKDQLRLWVQHLALNCTAGGNPLHATFVAADATVDLPPLNGCAPLLDRLLTLYRKGMNHPLRFFPESSLEYAKKARDPKKSFRALTDARGKWRGSDFTPGESDDRHSRRCFGDDDPLDHEFAAIAVEVWEPLLSHQKTKEQRW